jgi:hypothetical protein
MAPDRTTAALELALKLLSAVENAEAYLPGDVPLPGTLTEIGDTLRGALSAIKQQPDQIGGSDMYMRLRKELAAAGSETALADRIGIRRQSLSDVLTGRREAGPAVLEFLRLRRVTRTHYEHAEPQPKPAPKPRSERRQRAWDMLPRIPENNSPRM